MDKGNSHNQNPASMILEMYDTTTMNNVVKLHDKQTYSLYDHSIILPEYVTGYQILGEESAIRHINI